MHPRPELLSFPEWLCRQHRRLQCVGYCPALAVAAPSCIAAASGLRRRVHLPRHLALGQALGLQVLGRRHRGERGATVFAPFQAPCVGTLDLATLAFDCEYAGAVAAIAAGSSNGYNLFAGAATALPKDVYKYGIYCSNT